MSSGSSSQADVHAYNCACAQCGEHVGILHMEGFASSDRAPTPKTLVGVFENLTKWNAKFERAVVKGEDMRRSEAPGTPLNFRAIYLPWRDLMVEHVKNGSDLIVTTVDQGEDLYHNFVNYLMFCLLESFGRPAFSVCMKDVGLLNDDDLITYATTRVVLVDNERLLAGQSTKTLKLVIKNKRTGDRRRVETRRIVVMSPEGIARMQAERAEYEASKR